MCSAGWLRKIWDWKWVWAQTWLAHTWIQSSWEGQRYRRTTSSSSKGIRATSSLPRQPFLPLIASHSYSGCKTSAQPESPDSVLHSSSAYSQPFFPLLNTAHITWSYWILKPGSPLQQNFNILCGRLVSISCFEDNCSTTNSLLNPDLHFLEVLSN